MARRHFQTGCLIKKRKSWIFRYYEYEKQADGRVERVYRSVSFGPIKRSEAIKLRDDITRKLGLRGNRPKAAMSVSEFWSQHFREQIVEKKRLNTRKLYGSLYSKHIEPHFGQEKLCDIGRFDVQEFVSMKEKHGYSPQTVAHLRDVLSKMFGTAVLWGWLDENPTKGTTLPPMERKRVPRVLNFEEIARVIEKLREPARTLFALGITLGLRIGELLGLKLEDVDLRAGVLYVRRSISRGDIGPTKTPKSARRFPLPAEVVQMIGRYLKARPVHSEWLFPTFKGNHHNDRTLFLKYVQPVIRELTIPHFSWHSMRHTFLTYNGNQGVAMPVLQSLAGHTNAQTTLGYIDPLTEHKRTALERWVGQLIPFNPLFGVFDEASGGPKPLIH
jgi:integrase